MASEPMTKHIGNDLEYQLIMQPHHHTSMFNMQNFLDHKYINYIQIDIKRIINEIMNNKVQSNSSQYTWIQCLSKGKINVNIKDIYCITNDECD